MIPTPFRRRFCVCLLLCVAALCAHAEPRRTVRTHDEAPEAIDTAVVMDNVQVTAIKQGLTLRNRPVAASVVGRETIERRGVTAIKELSQLVPNFYIPDYGSRLTSAVYIRGIGSRINTPSVGLYVDNIPYIDKSAFDFDYSDIERIDVLRGPQGTLYGRNAMGGLIKIHTKSPFSYQGTDLRIGAGTHNAYSISLSLPAASMTTKAASSATQRWRIRRQTRANRPADASAASTCLPRTGKQT